MTAKKTSHADLEGKKTFFFQIGIIVSLLIFLAAFQWRTYDLKQLDISDRPVVFSDEDMVDITRQEIKLITPPPAQTLTTIINEVKNTAKVDDQTFFNPEAGYDTPVPLYVAPTPPKEEDAPEDIVFKVVEDMPAFPGGESARMKYLRDNIIYPRTAKESNIQGPVFVAFVVERDGSITDVRLLRGIGGGCDEEALRVVQSMPKWTPGKQRGIPVRVEYSMSIKFVLSE